jgi:hypothetical protein
LLIKAVPCSTVPCYTKSEHHMVGIEFIDKLDFAEQINSFCYVSLCIIQTRPVLLASKSIAAVTLSLFKKVFHGIQNFLTVQHMSAVKVVYK